MATCNDTTTEHYSVFRKGKKTEQHGQLGEMKRAAQIKGQAAVAKPMGAVDGTPT